MKDGVYAAEPFGRLAGLDYGAARPFSKWRQSHLETSIRGWLAFDPPGLELATMAYDELFLRRQELNSGLAFAGADLVPVPWLAEARAAVRALAETKRKEEAGEKAGRGKGNVYAILRGGYSADNQWYGVYVGSTAKSIEARYKEHRSGRRSARGLPRYGIEPLYSLCDPLNPIFGGKQKRLEWETRLHEALAPVVPKVTGDVAF